MVCFLLIFGLYLIPSILIKYQLKIVKEATQKKLNKIKNYSKNYSKLKTIHKNYKAQLLRFECIEIVCKCKNSASL